MKPRALQALIEALVLDVRAGRCRRILRRLIGGLFLAAIITLRLIVCLAAYLQALIGQFGIERLLAFRKLRIEVLGLASISRVLCALDLRAEIRSRGIVPQRKRLREIPLDVSEAADRRIGQRVLALGVFVIKLLLLWGKGDTLGILRSAARSVPVCRVDA